MCISYISRKAVIPEGLPLRGTSAKADEQKSAPRLPAFNFRQNFRLTVAII